jgi:hypothetical protein
MKHPPAHETNGSGHSANSDVHPPRDGEASPRSKLKRDLWKLAFAKASTDLARKACDFIIKNAGTLDAATYEALVTGIFVLYSRPFGGNKCVGCLPKKFGKFKDGRLQNRHEMILSARNGFVAHTDATLKYCNERGKEKETLLKLELIVNFGADGRPQRGTQIIRPQLMPKEIPFIKSLCEELLGKLDTEESLIIKKLFENRPMIEGPNPINIFDES